MKIDAKLTFNKVQFDQETEAHLVLEMTAPSVSVEDKRPPLCVVPLVDTSSSMYGDKLMYAKRSLIKLIEHLSPNDHCGLIDFADDAEIISRPVACTAEAKEDLKRKVGALECRGCTNIADALLKGFDIANKMDLSSEVILRVILFTDGNANRGPAQEPEQIVKLVESNKSYASISAFGYGTDVRQDMLLDVAKKGDGNYSFVKNPDDALSAFGKELGGLLSTYATNLIIDVNPLAGHSIDQVVSDVDVEEGGLGQVTIKVPDILSEEIRHLVLAVKLQPQKSAFPREVNVFEVAAGYDVLDANLRKEHKQLEVKAKAQFVKKGEHQEKPDEGLDKIVGLAQLVQAQIEAEEHAKQGNYDAAVLHMNNAASEFKTRGLLSVAAVSKGLSGKMASQKEYGANTAYFASVSRGVTRGVGGSYDEIAEADMCDLGVVMSNTAQNAVAGYFEADDGVDGTGDGTTVTSHGDTNGSPAVWTTDTSGDADPIRGIGGVKVAPGIGAANLEAIKKIRVDIPKGKDKPKKAKKKKLSQKSKRW